MDLKSKIGERSIVYREEASADRISKFRAAIGATIGDKSIAPPTFFTIYRRGEFDLFEKLGIPLSSVLHAEQEYRYENPILAGDLVKFQTSLTSVLEKRGASGGMQFLSFETVFSSDRDGKKFGNAKTTVVVRSKL